MLDELHPEQLDEWIAWRQLEPDPMERLTQIVKLGFTALCNAWGGKLEPDDLDPLKKADAAQTPEQTARLFTYWAQSQGQGS